MPVTNYIRFFHSETHHLTFAGIETMVTLLVLLVFVVLPVRFPAVFPNRCFCSFAQRRLRACVAVFLLSFFGRIALLPIEPFPPPRVQDEFSYLLASETFAHGRLTNPTPPQWHHFEAFHVLMQPTYMSKYGAAAPLFMAFGERFFGTPRVGVLLSMALAAASLCWMLQAYLPAEWALLGGLLAIVRMSWFSYFGNGYWGGSVAMLGGCLLLGAAARLARKPKPHYGLLMAAGLILLANSRPFEGALLSLPIGLYTLWILLKRRVSLRVLLPGVAVLLLGTVLTGYYCYRVTGRLTFPWVAHWQQWGMTPPFLFRKPNYSVHYQFPEQLTYNRDVDMAPYRTMNTKVDFLAELVAKGIYQWLFFIFPALTLPLIGLIPTWRARRSRVLIYTLAFTCLGFLIGDVAPGTLLRCKHRHCVSHPVERVPLDAGAWPEKRSLAQTHARHVGVDCHHGWSAADSSSDRGISYLGYLDEPGRSDSCMARHSPHHGIKGGQTAGDRPLSSRSFLGERAGSTTATTFRPSM